MFLTFAICFETAVIIFHIGDFGTMIVHTEDGDEVAESPIFPRIEFIPGLGSINSFTHDPKRAELISSFWYEKHTFILLFVFSVIQSSLMWSFYLSRHKSYAQFLDRAENTGDSDANKDRDLDDRPDIQESKAIPPLTGTVKKHIGAEGTIRRHDNQVNLSPGLANTTTKLNSSPSRKAFSVQDKVYGSWFRHQLFVPLSEAKVF